MPSLSHSTSASSIECVVRMMARFFFASFTTFHRLFLDAGSSPVLGSSMNTTLGSPISEIATLSLRFMPPLYFPTCLSPTPP
uniref:Uncharacterized protein n=1 Tax=Arundo donax TaxID=35708 RepID=A0A0A9DGI0_ARUDO